MLIVLNLFLFFLLFFYYLVSDLLIWWLLLEVFFYVILVVLFFYVREINNLIGVIIYFFVQRLVSILFIFLLVLFIRINNVGFSFLIYILFFVFLFKIRFFPFYYQVVFIFTKLNNQQCFVIGFYPKVLPLMWIFTLNVYCLSFIVFFYLIFTFLISAYFRVKSVDIRELIRWSSVNFRRWVLISVLCNSYIFIILLVQYCISTFIFFFILLYLFGNFFINNYERVSLGNRVFVFLNLLLITRIAPIRLFIFKLFLLIRFSDFFSIRLLVFILICLIGSFFFYLRILQLVLNLRASYSSFNVNIKRMTSFIYFFLFFVNIFLIILILSI